MERKINLEGNPDRGYLILSASGLGRILGRPEVAEIVARLGSELIYRPTDNYAQIRPPLPPESFDELEDALKAFVHSKEPGVEVGFDSYVESSYVNAADAVEDFVDDMEEPNAA